MIYILFFYFFCYGHSFIFFVMRRFIDESSEEKNRCAAGEFEGGWGGRGTASPPKWDPGAKPRKILAILHCE